MNDLSVSLLSGIAGLALGTFFFGGLWWTLRKVLVSSRPALWLLSSTVLRLGVSLAGFYLVADGLWPRMLACVAGFVLARFILLRLAPPPTLPFFTPRQVRHAPRS